MGILSTIRHRRTRNGAFRNIALWRLLVVTENNLTQPEALFASGWQASLRNERREELRIWVDNAWRNGNSGAGAPTIYYTNWPAHGDYAPSPNWRQRLADNEVEWMARVNYAEANSVSGAPKIRVIPGNALMMRIYDDAQRGLIPGVSDAASFLANRSGWWLDDVHPGPYLSLALGYMHMMVIHGTNPHNLPYTGLGLSTQPDLALANYLRDVVIAVVNSTPRAKY